MPTPANLRITGKYWKVKGLNVNFYKFAGKIINCKF